MGKTPIEPNKIQVALMGGHNFPKDVQAGIKVN
jgi:hypothetical protein